MTRGPLVEVAGNVRIYARPPRDPLAMEPGNRGRFRPGGDVYEVDRVTTCAAYLHRVYDPPIRREIPGRGVIRVRRGRTASMMARAF